MFVFGKKNARFVNCLTSGQAARQKIGRERLSRAEFFGKSSESQKFALAHVVKKSQIVHDAEKLA